MADQHLGAQWRHLARVLRGEAKVEAAMTGALELLVSYSAEALASAGMDPSVLDARYPAWREVLGAEVVPTIEGVFEAAFKAAGRGVINPDVYSTRHIESVWNRLVATSDEVFDAMRTQLAEGRALAEGIPELTARVDALLGDTDRWKGRARVIARTEVIGANNAGAYDGARATADLLETAHGDVVKEWLATGDSRTRESHAAADGQMVLGMDQAFDVGGSELQYPGDPDGDAGEVVNCRCTVLFHYPGDEDYPDTLTAAAAHQEARMTALTAAGEDEEERTGVVVVALPAEDDPVHGIGPEEKHATLLYFGDVEGGDTPNALLTDDFRTLLSSAIAAVATDQSPRTGNVDGVESLGGAGARVWKLDGPPLTDLRDAVLDADSEVATVLAGVEQFPTYTPHVTIGYADVEEDDAPPSDDVTVEGELDTATEEAAAAVTSIRFDRIALWWAGEHTEWQLATSDQEDDVTGPTDEAVTAAAGDPAPVPVEDTGEDMAAGDPAPALMPEDPDAESDRFHGVVVVEDEQTGDGRVFAAGALSWEPGDLPMPAGWQVSDAPGHDGSMIFGRIDTFERVGNTIEYEGTYDLDGVGWEVRRLVAGKFLRGVSVDVDNGEATMVMPDGTPLDGMDMFIVPEEEPILLVTRGRIRSMAACRVPAFNTATIENGPRGSATSPAEDAPEETPTEEETLAELVAAAVRVDAPPAVRTAPPAEHFTDPGLTEPTAMTITEDGRVFGHLALWGTCHIGFDGTCVTPPFSQAAYAYFLTGETETDAGYTPTGLITMGTGHAAAQLGHRPAAAHYDDTGLGVASVACGEDSIGIWYSGHMHDGIPEQQTRKLRAAGQLSGDWRRIAGNLELVAALAVNTPGFPVPRLGLAASADGVQLSLVASGLVPRPVVVQPTGHDLEQLTASVLAALDRRERVAAIKARLTDHRLSRAKAAAARITANRVNDATTRLERNR